MYFPASHGLQQLAVIPQPLLALLILTGVTGMWLLTHLRINNERKGRTIFYNLLFPWVSLWDMYFPSREIFLSRGSHMALTRNTWGLSTKEQPKKAKTLNHKHPFITLICFHWSCVLSVLTSSKYCSSWVPMEKKTAESKFSILVRNLFARNSWCPFLVEMLDTLSSGGTHVCLKMRCFSPDPWGSFPKTQWSQPPLKVDAWLGKALAPKTKGQGQ